MSFRNKTSIPLLCPLRSTISYTGDHLFSPVDLICYYNFELQILLDALAPRKTTNCLFCLVCTLVNSWALSAQIQKPSPGMPLQKNWTYCTQKQVLYKNALIAAKSGHYNLLLAYGKGTQKSLFSPVNSILKSSDTFLTHLYRTAQCDAFMALLNGKITNIYQQPAYSSTHHSSPHCLSADHPLTFFFIFNSPLNLKFHFHW